MRNVLYLRKTVEENRHSEESLRLLKTTTSPPLLHEKLIKFFTVDSANYIIAHAVRAIKRLSEEKDI